MGPYCKFCGDRCFIPTEKNDYIKTDIKATCLEGIKFDMSSTYSELLSKDEKYLKGWILDLRRGEEYSLAAEIIGGQVLEYEIKNNEIEEVIDLVTPSRINKRLFYRSK